VSVIASWPGILRAAARHPERLVVSAGRRGGSTRSFLRYDPLSTELLEAAERETPYPGHGDFRPDRYTAALALRYLRTQRPRFLFVGLGEPDAYAHRGLYRDYLVSLRQADAVVGEIDELLAELQRQGYPTTLFVTTDHGRSRGFTGHGAKTPESARVWLVASGAGIRARGMVESTTERRLADVAPTIRHLAGLQTEPSTDAGRVITELVGSR
jgi:arylsulfatase A-like enzyme